MFLSVAPAPSYLRLCSVSLPAFILLVWFVSSLGTYNRAFLCVLWAVALFLMVVEPAARQTQWRVLLDVPTGRTAFLRPVVYEKSRWVFQRTRPGDFFFGDQLITLALGLRDPAEVDFIRPTDYTRPEQVRNLVAVVEENRVRFVMWYAGLGSPVNNGLAGDHLGLLRAYLRRHYHLAKTFPNLDEIWERNR